jgi:hypothetical protein
MVHGALFARLPGALENARQAGHLAGIGGAPDAGQGGACKKTGSPRFQAGRRSLTNLNSPRFFYNSFLRVGGRTSGGLKW